MRASIIWTATLIAFVAARVGASSAAAGDAAAKPPMAAEFQARDQDADGSLTLDEFLAPIEVEWRRGATRDFHMLDSDANGALSLDDFAKVPGVARPEDRMPYADRVVDWLERSFERLQESVRLDGGDLKAGVAVRAWPRGLDGLSPQLASMPGKTWDRDGDGVVTSEECRWWLEVAYGLRRPDGADLRTGHGPTINHIYLRGLDKDSDGAISRAEFITAYWAGPDKNPEIFKRFDLDGDGRLRFAELTVNPSFHLDAVVQIARYDVNFDGYVTRQELVAKATKPQMALAERVVRAFDDDRDGRLSLYEFSGTPFNTGSIDLYHPGKDDDDDAKLSWGEFYRDESLFGVELAREYFNRFDLDQDGALDFAELAFPLRLDKISPEIAFQIQDKDADGKLLLGEIFTEKKPAADDAPGLERYQMRLARAEDRFAADDADGGGSLDLNEFTRAREAALAVARRSSALRGRDGPERGVTYWARKAVLVFNGAAIVMLALFLLRRRARSADAAHGDAMSDS